MRYIPFIGERRLARRRPAVANKLILWGQSADRLKSRGWLHDFSPGGVGFITGRMGRPMVGGQIELLPARGRGHLQCRVVRVADHEDESLIVGCELTSDGPAPAARAPRMGPLAAAAALCRKVRLTGRRAATLPPAGVALSSQDRSAAAA